ncbi:tyrosine-type recombinase/integrase [Aestuariibius insulae]|uniref:tyrosine-type recombinase/integrase n=1 Tax=Aestuariibius insulae TaxID=2058287 RepID=UPI00345EC301
MPDISLGRLRGGFCVYWDDADSGKRRRHQLKAGTVREAEAEAIEVYRRETFVARKSAPIVSEIWNAYREDLGDKPTAITMGWTGKAILPHFGALRSDLIERSHCRAYADMRITEGKSIGTVHTELGHLQSALKWAEKVRMIDRATHIFRPSKPESDKRILSRGEAAALIDGAFEPHIRLAIILMLGTAARIGSLLDLTWDRVSFEGNNINLRLPDTVTRKGRANVPMNAMVRAALSSAQDAALSDYVVEYAGGPIKSIRSGFQGAVARSGIGHIRIHDIRHTAAVTMLSEGVNMTKVSQMLGHSNTATTFKVYGRYLPGHMQDAADVLDFTRIRTA